MQAKNAKKSLLVCKRQCYGHQEKLVEEARQ